MIPFLPFLPFSLSFCKFMFKSRVERGRDKISPSVTIFFFAFEWFWKPDYNLQIHDPLYSYIYPFCLSSVSCRKTISDMKKKNFSRVEPIFLTPNNNNECTLEPAWFVILYRLSIQYIYTHVCFLCTAFSFVLLFFFSSYL